MTYEIIVDGQPYTVELKAGNEPGKWHCRIQAFTAPQREKPQKKEKNEKQDWRELNFSAAFSGENVLSVLLDGKSYEVKETAAGQSRYIALGGKRYEIEMRDPRSLRTRRAAAGAEDGPRKLLASMPGKIVRVLTPEGTQVEAGQGVIVVEAMKMQNELKSPKSGMVKKVLAPEGAAVNAGDTLVIVD